MISCVMPTYNQGAYLRDAIESVLAQTYRDFELIIVNDGSTDDTRCILASITDPRVTVIHKQNGGTGSALNRGFSIARGDLETWWASDNIMYPDNFQWLLDGLDDTADLVYASCHVRDYNTGEQWLYSDRHPFKRIDFRPGGMVDKLYFPSIMWLWRRELRERAGLFSPMPCEDCDMLLRMEEVGRFKYLGKHSTGLYLLKNEASITGIDHPFAKWNNERLRQNARVRRNETKVSITMPVYNREKTIARALDSCINQTYWNWEVLAVDDGSTDKTLSILRHYAQRDPRIRIFPCKHRGCYPARNECLRHIQGAYVALLDSDDEQDPRRLEKSVAMLEAEGLDFVTCGARIFQEDGTLEDDYLLPLKPDAFIRGDLNAIPICPSVVFRRGLIDAAGPYDESLPFGEDADMLARFCVAGARYGFLPEPLYIYHRGPDQITAKHVAQDYYDLAAARTERYLPQWEERLADV